MKKSGNKKKKHKDKEIKNYFPINKGEIYIHFKNIPQNVFTPLIISYGLDVSLLKILNFFFFFFLLNR